MTPTPNTYCLMPITTDTSDLELIVMNWFAAGYEVLWIPIYEVAEGSNGIADACNEANHFGVPRPIHDFTDFYCLPIGIKGWVFPAHLDDTDVICLRETPSEIGFGHLQHPATGQRLTYRYDTEAPIRRHALWCRTEREL